MLIYLPIAEITVNIGLFLSLGMAVGFIAGMFGIGGGFLMTPLLMFAGIPASVAVASESGQISASSLTGALTFWRKRSIDFRLGWTLVGGGVIGTSAGVWVFRYLRELGHLEVVVAIGFFSLLAIVGSVMLVESVLAVSRQKSASRPASVVGSRHHSWIHGLPFRVKFRTSKLYVSIIPVIFVGMFIGFIGAILGIGGGFIMIPALIYVLHVPIRVVIGTSLFHIAITMGIACILYAGVVGEFDVVLSVILTVGAVFGTQLGVQVGQRINGELLRVLLAFVVLGVAVRFGINLLSPGPEQFSVAPLMDMN